MGKKLLFETPALEKETIESLSAKLLSTNEKLAAANAELRRAQKEQSEMLANISHDLRAPLTAIRSTLDYLLSQPKLPQEEYERLLSLMDRRTKTLEELIRDLYELFCIEDSSKELPLETIDAAPFLEEYFYDCLADSRFDSHDMRLELPPALDCKITVDVQRLVRVLDNLFSNAARYTPADSCICLSAELLPASDNPSSVPFLQICVADNGPGIPAEDVPFIFGRTYTVSRARTPGAPGGSGLGLAIVKAIMERHGGTVSCQSESGRGCLFTLTLPASPASPQSAVTPSP